MLQIDTFLATVAQVGVAVPGFAGVIMSIRRNDAPMSPQDREGFRLMLGLSTIAIFGALLPFAVPSWQVCSLALGLATGVVTAHEFASYLRYGTGPNPPRSRPLLRWAIHVPLSVVCLLAIANAMTGWVALYALGLLAVLAVSLVQFWVAVMMASRASVGG
jgi:hypothetical protein